MRSNVETRMSKACNAPLALRESCPRCADKARARLHADGVARDERLEAYGPRPSAGLPGSLEGIPVEELFRFDPHIIDEAVEWWNRGCTPVPKHEPPPVGAEVSYEVALADMQRRPEARYWAPSGQCVYGWFKGAMCYSHESVFYVNVLDRDELGRGKWVRLEDGSTGPLHSHEHRRIENLRSELRAKVNRLPDAIPYTPAIGAEVSWDEAKRDMQARGMRYRPESQFGVEYSWGISRLVRRDHRGGGWLVSEMTDDDAALSRWVRL